MIKKKVMPKVVHLTLSNLDATVSKLIPLFTSKTVLFKGEMGTGKTTLISKIIEKLGSKDSASSPTFSIVNEYKIPDGIVYHFDFYRIKSVLEALDFGIEDYLYSNHWVFMEWPENIKPLWPETYNIIEIKIQNNSERTLTIYT